MPTKDKGAIVKWSGGDIRYIEVDDNGGVASGASWAQLGYIQESTVSDNTEQEDLQDETGNTVKVVDNGRVVKITGLLMMSDKATMDLLKETVRSNYYMVYKYEGQVNGKHQEIFAGICQFKPMVELQSGVKRIPFEINVSANREKIYLVDSAQSDTVLWTSGGAVSTGDYVYYGGRLYQDSSAGGGNFTTTPPTHVSGTVSNGDADLDWKGYYVLIDTTNMNADASTPFYIDTDYYWIVKETTVS